MLLCRTTLRIPFHVVVTGLHVGKDGGIHPLLHFVGADEFPGFLLHRIGDEGYHVVLRVQHTKIHVCSAASAATIGEIRAEEVSSLHPIDAGERVSENRVTASRLHLDLASVGGKGTFNGRFRIARQLRHVARVQEVAFGVIDFESGAVHELLCARVVFNATCADEVHRDFCHRLVAAKICGLVECEAQATLYVVFRGNREIRRRKLVRCFVPHGERIVAGEESLRFEIGLSRRKREFTNEVLRVAIHNLHFQWIVVVSPRQQPVGTARRVADAVRLRYAAVVQVAHGRMSNTEF